MAPHGRLCHGKGEFVRLALACYGVGKVRCLPPSVMDRRRIDLDLHTVTSLRHDWSYSEADTMTDILERMQYLRPSFELRER